MKISQTTFWKQFPYSNLDQSWNHLHIQFSFPDDLHDARNSLTELTRRLHELEIELRRLENEREELTAAYKEAEAVSSWRRCPFGVFTLTLVFFRI